MILSNVAIRQALAAGEVEISPQPGDDQYTTSAVDLFLGNDFRVWDDAKLRVQGVRFLLTSRPPPGPLLRSK